MKKAVIAAIAVIGIDIALILCNLFLFEFPEWVVLIPIAIAAVATVFLWAQKGKLRVKLLITPLVTIFSGLLLFCAFCNPYWNSLLLRGGDYTADYDTVLTYTEASEDLDYLYHYLKKDHPTAYEHVPEFFETAYQQALKEMKTEDITVVSLYRRLQQMLSLFGDAHTTTYVNYQDMHYIKDIQQRKDAGEHLVRVNGLLLSELFEQKRELFCYEIDSWGIRKLTNQLSSKENLTFLGIDVSESLCYTYENPEGICTDYTYTPEDFLTYAEYVEYNRITKKEATPFVSCEIDSERNLAILTLKECNYNQEYRDCLRQMFRKVKELGIQNIVVDLRDNGGGDSRVADDFIRYLDVDSYLQGAYYWRFGCFTYRHENKPVKNDKYKDLLFYGDVYVLTSIGSFSSAMLFAEYVKDNALGTIIGETPGNVPTGYGDIATFQLPNSGIYFQVSTKSFVRADEGTDEIAVIPDYECEKEEAFTVLYQVLEEQ